MWDECVKNAISQVMQYSGPLPNIKMMTESLCKAVSTIHFVVTKS